MFEETNKCLSTDPYGNGKRLLHEWKGFWRYRFGDYRIIYEIIESQVLVNVIEVDNRKDVL